MAAAFFFGRFVAVHVACKRAVGGSKAGVGFCDTAPQTCLSSGALRVRPAKFQV